MLDVDKIARPHPIATSCPPVALTSPYFVCLACLDKKDYLSQLTFPPLGVLQIILTLPEDQGGTGQASKYARGDASGTRPLSMEGYPLCMLLPEVLSSDHVFTLEEGKRITSFTRCNENPFLSLQALPLQCQERLRIISIGSVGAEVKSAGKHCRPVRLICCYSITFCPCNPKNRPSTVDMQNKRSTQALPKVQRTLAQ